MNSFDRHTDLSKILMVFMVWLLELALWGYKEDILLPRMLEDVISWVMCRRRITQVANLAILRRSKMLTERSSLLVGSSI